MKIAKTFLIIFIVGLGLLLTSLIGLGAFAYFYPEKITAALQDRFVPKDLKVSWKNLTWGLHAKSTHEWTPSVELTDLCIVKALPSLNICFEQLWVQSRVSWAQIFHPDFEITELFVQSLGQSSLNLGPSKGPKSSGSLSPFEEVRFWQMRFNKYLHLVSIQKLAFEIDHFQLVTDKNSSLNFRISVRSLEFLKQVDFDLQIQREKFFNLDLAGSLYPNQILSSKDDILSLRGKVLLPKLSIDLQKVHAGWINPNQIQTEILAAGLWQKRKGQIRLGGVLSENELRGDFVANLSGFKPPLNHLRPVRGSFSIPQRTGRVWAAEETEFGLHGRVPLYFVKPSLRADLEKSCRCQIPVELAVDLSGRAHLARYFANQDGRLLEANAAIESLKNGFFSSKVHLGAAVDQQNQQFQIVPKVDSEIVLHSFQGLVVLLKNQKIIVPAPLANLDGVVTLSTKGAVQYAADHYVVPFQIQTALQSSRQQVRSLTTGAVSWDMPKKVLGVGLDVLIQDLILQLPPLDPLYGMPKIVKDSRFELEPPKLNQKGGKTKLNLKVKAHIHTDRPDSIQLLYTYAHPGVLFGMDLDYQTGSPITGQISIVPFQIEYLRRKSTVQKFEIHLNNPLGVFPMNARFSMEQNPYRIFVDVVGTASSPHILLSSEPYLDRQDIISLLLYGRVSNKLISAEASTAGQFDAALADRAIGLLGLWAFASTPVQSFSYNQLTKQYSAQLRLSSDSTLGVGTNWEQSNSIEIKKRLSDRWMISASLEPTEEDQQTRTLRLQWENRF